MLGRGDSVWGFFFLPSGQKSLVLNLIVSKRKERSQKEEEKKKKTPKNQSQSKLMFLVDCVLQISQRTINLPSGAAWGSQVRSVSSS